jgi:hypothetical protein
MSTRTIEHIEAEIQVLKRDNPSWTTNAVDKTLIAELQKEKVLLLQKENIPTASPQRISQFLLFL